KMISTHMKRTIKQYAGRERREYCCHAMLNAFPQSSRLGASRDLRAPTTAFDGGHHELQVETFLAYALIVVNQSQGDGRQRADKAGADESTSRLQSIRQRSIRGDV